MSRWLFIPTKLLSWDRHCEKDMGRGQVGSHGSSGFEEEPLSPPPPPPLSAPALSDKLWATGEWFVAVAAPECSGVEFWESTTLSARGSHGRNQ